MLVLLVNILPLCSCPDLLRTKTIWSLLKLRAKSALQPVFNDTKCAHGESKKDIKGLVLEFLILESLKYLNLVTEKL